MGCGASNDASASRATPSKSVVVNRATTVSPGSHHNRPSVVGTGGRVSFAVANNEYYDYSHSQSSFAKRDSLRSLDTIDSVALMSMIGAPVTEVPFSEELSYEGKRVLGVVRCALDINDREVAKAHMELIDRVEAELAAAAAAKAQLASQEPATPVRMRRGQNQQPRDGAGGLDRPPTPTGYVTEEPSAASTQMKRAVDDFKKKFTTFFTGGGEDDEEGNVPATPLKYAPSKIGDGLGSEMGGGGSVFQASQYNGSMRGSFVSALTQSSNPLQAQGAVGADGEVIDEKVVQRTRVWVTDHIGVVVRVLEVYRRKLRAVERDEAVSESISAAMSVNHPHHPQVAANGPASTPTATTLDPHNSSNNSGVIMTSLEVTKLFLPTISVDPLEEYNKLVRVPNFGDDASSSNNGTPRTTAASTSNDICQANNSSFDDAGGSGSVVTPRSKVAVTKKVASSRNADSHLNKRNLDKLQEKLAAMESKADSSIAEAGNSGSLLAGSSVVQSQIVVGGGGNASVTLPPVQEQPGGDGGALHAPVHDGRRKSQADLEREFM